MKHFQPNFVFILVIFIALKELVVICELVANLDKDFLETKYLDEQENDEHEINADDQVHVGDTSHLFTKEDFEKKEAQLTRDETTTQKEESSPIKVENLTSSSIANKCLRSNLTVYRDNNTVQLVNGSRLTLILSNSEPNECFLVFFYVPWCVYSAKLAPIYNALPRIFLNLDILAFDVSASFGYNTKFGTSAVPIILLFQNKLVSAKYNYTHKTISNYAEFISNNTGFSYNSSSVFILQEDFDGPVPSVPVKKFEYAVLFSWLFLIYCSIEVLLRKTLLATHLLNLFKRLLSMYRGPLRLPPNETHFMIEHTANPQQPQQHLHED